MGIIKHHEHVDKVLTQLVVKAKQLEGVIVLFQVTQNWHFRNINYSTKKVLAPNYDLIHVLKLKKTS